MNRSRTEIEAEIRVAAMSGATRNTDFTLYKQDTLDDVSLGMYVCTLDGYKIASFL